MNTKISGSITRHRSIAEPSERESLFLVPQMVYMIDGTLADQITYPQRLSEAQLTSEVLYLSLFLFLFQFHYFYFKNHVTLRIVITVTTTLLLLLLSIINIIFIALIILTRIFDSCSCPCFQSICSSRSL